MMSNKKEKDMDSEVVYGIRPAEALLLLNRAGKETSHGGFIILATIAYLAALGHLDWEGAFFRLTASGEDEIGNRQSHLRYYEKMALTAIDNREALHLQAALSDKEIISVLTCQGFFEEARINIFGWSWPRLKKTARANEMVKSLIYEFRPVYLYMVKIAAKPVKTTASGERRLTPFELSHIFAFPSVLELPAFEVFRQKWEKYPEFKLLARVAGQTSKLYGNFFRG